MAQEMSNAVHRGGHTTAAHTGGSISGASIASSVGYGGEIKANAARASHIPEELSLLMAAVNDLSVEVDSLIPRLSNVTGEIPFPADAGENPPDSYRVPVAQDIRTQRRRIQAVTDLVRRLNSAIEL